MSGSCYHLGCKSGYRGNKTHLFGVQPAASDETKRQWMKNVPKRTDRDFNFETCRLCFKHFEDRFIIKESVVTMNGEVIYSVDRKRWSLTVDAVPTIFANDKVPAYYNVKTYSRKPPKERREIPPVKLKVPAVVEELPSPWEIIKKHADALRLPNDFWKLYNNCANSLHVTLTEFTEQGLPVTMKYIHFKNDLSFEVYLEKTNITSTFSVIIDGVEDVQNMINKVDKLFLCHGHNAYSILDEKMLKIAVKRDGIWFANDCSEISEKQICDKCERIKPHLSRAQNRIEHFKKRQAEKLEKKMNYKRKRRTNKALFLVETVIDTNAEITSQNENRHKTNGTDQF